jgi:hypothetical protein
MEFVMSENVAENLVETGSISESKVSVENAVADMGKAATLAEWVYAGLRFETRDWSAELRKSSEVQLPKFAQLGTGADHTGSVAAEASDQRAAPVKHVGSSVGVSGQADAALDHMLLGVREAKVMGQDGFRQSFSADHQPSAKTHVEMNGSVAAWATPSKVTSPTTPVVETPAVEVVATPVVVAPVVATPVVEVVATPVVEVVATPVVVASVVEAPVVEVVAIPVVVTPVVETPVVEVVATPVVVATVVQTPVVEVVATPVVETPVVQTPVVEVIATPVVVAPIVQTPVIEVVATPVVMAPVVEAPVIEAPVVETPVVVAPVVETPAVEVIATPVVVAPVVQTPVVVAPVVQTPVVEVVEAPVVVTPVVETPAVEVIATPVVVAPVVEETVAPIDVSVPVATAPESDLHFGRLYFHDFDSSRAKIVIQSDSITSFDSLIANANLYQDEASTVFELDNGADLIILTQFSLGNISADMFVFEPASLTSEAAQVFVRNLPVEVAETPVSGDVFNFGLGSGHIYVTDFDTHTDQIFIKADLFSNFDEMMSRVAVYQDETSTVIELHNGADIITMTHFSINDLSADMFVFEAETVTTNPQDHSTVALIEHGSNFDDTLIFGSGDQMIDPGQGFDVVTGGEGRDTFIFGAMSGHDFIVDFKAGEDRIQIDSDLASGFADLLDHASIYQDGGATQIEFSGGQMVTLYDTSAKLASADWFSFS